VKIDGHALGDGGLDVSAEELDGKVIQVGKRRFARVRLV
jgi:hypothetical protein